jgi:hypothetical protein
MNAECNRKPYYIYIYIYICVCVCVCVCVVCVGGWVGGCVCTVIATEY